MRTFAAALAGAVFMAGSAFAQSYPEQPVRLVIGFAAGGGMDAIARTVGQALSRELGQQVVVENRPGAGGTVAMGYTAGVRPDGYTIILSETSALIGPVIYDEVSYDPQEDFVPVAHLTSAPLAFVANPSLEADDMASFIDLAQARPGELFYATSGVATVQHLAGELLKQQAGIDMEDAPFQGGAPSVTAVVSGEVPVAIVSLGAAVSQAEGGAVKILGITYPERLEAFPDLVPIAETLEGYSASPSQFILAPKDTPAEVIEILSNAVGAAMEQEELITALSNQGFLPDYKTGEQLASEMPAIIQQWTEAAESLDAVDE